MLRVLVACERSGIVREAFRAVGCDAWSCDLVESYDCSPKHLIGDARAFLDMGWDLLIAHPPCTRLANSGVLRLYNDGKAGNGINPAKWREMEESAEFFKAFLHCRIPRRCIENPKMHGHAIERIGRSATHFIQPYEFGEDASKETGLWLFDLPLLRPTTRLRGRIVEWPPGSGKWVERWANQTASGQNKLAPSDTRAIERAITYPGIALAMAEQWGVNQKFTLFD